MTAIEEEKKFQINTASYFPCNVYTIERPDFLEVAGSVCEEFILKHKDQFPVLDEVYPVRMTESFYAHPALKDFSVQILAMSWSVLKQQGYDMDKFETFFTNMWCQEHHKHSLQEQHVHMFGEQIVGFYFIECPENSCNVLFYDPKPGKVQLGIPEENMQNITFASNFVGLKPVPGLIILSNAWLPHSFTRNASDKPMRFIHFNVGVRLTEQVNPNVEVI